MGLARTIAALFSRSAKPSSSDARREPRKSDNPQHLLGRRGERLAEKHLRKHGYKILYRNFRAKHGGEVDLVCRDLAEATLVFVEVKTRRRDDLARPAESVNRDKQGLIARAARAWLQMLDNPAVPFRFDIVEIVIEENTAPRFNIVKSAFVLPEAVRR